MQGSRRVLACIAIAGKLWPAVVAQAAEPAYPQHPVRMISGSVGSTADLTARFIAQKLGERWAYQVVVDNRSGAGGRTRAVNRVPACGM